MRRKRFKTITSVALALLMTLSTCTTVFANPDADSDVTADPPQVATTIPEQSEDMQNLRENTLVGLPARSDRAPTFFVSPNGNDNNDGRTRGTAFATLDRARLAVREILPSATSDIVVELAGGLYQETSVVFGPEDSGRPGVTVYYQAAAGERPILSAGFTLEQGIWDRVPADEVPQAGGLPVYRTSLDRDGKLRHMYVNEQRANMTLSGVIGSSLRSMTGVPTVNIRTRFHADPNHESANPQEWAWHARNNVPAGIIFHQDVGITADTRNPHNIESSRVAGAARWARPFITFESVTNVADCAVTYSRVPAAFRGGLLFRYQMPYGAIAHSLSDNTNFSGNNDQVIRNAWEFFNRRGDFYFDEDNQNLYYIPRSGENINTAEVVIPYYNTVIDIAGVPVGDRLNPNPANDLNRVRFLTFSGLTLAHTDYRLEQLEGTYIDSVLGMRTTHSTGFASIQGCIVATAFLWSEGHGGGGNHNGMNWHNAMYRHYDLPPAALQINAARNIRFLNGEVILTGFNGINIINDVRDIEITGNLIRDTLAGAIAVGHPTHIYENDEAGVHESPLMTFINGFTFADAPWDNLPQGGTPAYRIAGVDKEVFPAGTEAVPQDIYITNNVIWRIGYGFPGVNAVTAFYTTNLQILHNLMYDATYGAVSLGWGWCEFDGYGWNADGTPMPGAPNGNEAANKAGGPFQGTHEASFARIAPYTTTSRSNRVNHNIIENCMVYLADSGAIYTLGRQGDPGNLPDGGSWFTLRGSNRALTNSPVTDPTHNWYHGNWRNYTTMNFNFLNPIADGSSLYEAAWANAIHPDEGSTFIKMEGNVMRSRYTTNRRFIELNNWKRKSDMHATNNFTTESNLMNGAPRITFLQPHANNQIVPNALWPLDAHDIILGAGPENQFIHLVPDAVRPATELELRGFVRARASQMMNLGGHLSAEDTVWLAPAGTTEFAESEYMTSSPGNVGAIMIPEVSGIYHLFIEFADGTVQESKYNVESTPLLSNLVDGRAYRVSEMNPLVINLNTEEFNFTLNGGPVNDGHKIADAGSWTLVATARSNASNVTTINFTTYVTVADRLLPQNLTVATGQPIRFAFDLNDPDVDIWVVHGSNQYFDPEGTVSSRLARGTDLQVYAPTVSGPGYVLVVVEAGTIEPILSQSMATISVVEGGAEPQWPQGVDRPETWFSSSQGVSLNAAGHVSRWDSIGTVEGRAATPGAHNNTPPRMVSMDGYARQAVQFNGGHLIFNHPINNLRDFSMLAFSAHTGQGTSGNSDAVVFWNESGSWGQTGLSPRRNNIQHKFGTSQGSDSPTWSRPAGTQLTNNCFSVTAATKQDGGGAWNATTSIERIFVDGQQVRQITGRFNELRHNRDLANIGRTITMGGPGGGAWQTGADTTDVARFDLAELMIFNRTLSAAEVATITEYLQEKHMSPIGQDGRALLRTLIAAVQALDSEEYCPYSWEALMEALESALYIVVYENADQAMIDAAHFALRDAKAALQAADDTVLEARSLLPNNVTVSPEALVALAVDLNDAEASIWLAPEGTSVANLNENAANMSRVDGDRISIPAPSDVYEYQLLVVRDNAITSRSVARVRVAITPEIPTDGLYLWLDASRGVEVNASGHVVGWENQAEYAYGPYNDAVLRIADQTAAPLPPNMTQRWGTPYGGLGLPAITGYPTAGVANAGYDFVSFGPNARPLGVDDFHNFNGATEMTMFTLANPTNVRNTSADQNGVLYFGDIGWSGINLGLGIGGVNVRFGNGVPNNGGNMTAATDQVYGLTSVVARMDGPDRIIRVNGNQVGQNTQSGNNIPINNTRSILQVGYALGGWYTNGAARPFRGEIAQILLYNRALSNQEVEQVEDFLAYMASGGVTAMLNLELLANLIAYAEAIEEGYYTEYSWENLVYALDQARMTVAEADVTQIDVDAAFNALRSAIVNLEEGCPTDCDCVDCVDPGCPADCDCADCTIPVDYVLIDVIPTAVVTQMTGSQNHMVVTITEIWCNGTNQIEVKYDYEYTMKDNNSDYTIQVGSRTVFVSVRGNTQVREIRIIE